MDEKQRIGFQHTALRAALAGIVACWAAVGLSGCLQNYGRLKSNPEVTEAFRNYRMLEGYRYFYSGRENLPTAIIGVRPKYLIESELWQPIEPTPAAFKKMVNRVVPPSGYDPRGADILTPAGEPAGVWFSVTPQTAVQLQDNRLSVFPPRRVSGGGDGSK